MNNNLKYLEEQYPEFLSLWLKNGIFKELKQKMILESNKVTASNKRFYVEVLIIKAEGV